MQEGIISAIVTKIEKNKLRVQITAEEKEGEFGQITAFLPNRELSALLPRDLLVPDLKNGDTQTLETIDSMLKKVCLKRSVRLYEYKGKTYASFPSWSRVEFSITGTESGSPILQENS